MWVDVEHVGIMRSDDEGGMVQDMKMIVLGTDDGLGLIQFPALGMDRISH